MDRDFDEAPDPKAEATPPVGVGVVEPGRQARPLGLRHLMGLSAVVALPMAAIVQAIRTEADGDIILAILAVAATLVALGGFASQRVPRYASLGWLLVGSGPILGSVVLVGASTDWDLPPMILTIVVEVPVAIGVVQHLVGRQRALHQEATLWVLALASGRSRPLGPAVRALGAQSSGVYRLRDRLLAECLEAGMTLPDALEFVPSTAPAPARLLARVGHDAGRLPEALADAATGRSDRTPGWQAFGAKLGYLCLIAVVLQGIAGFVVYFHAPHLEAIFRDYNVPLPGLTTAVFRLSRLATSGFALPLLATVEGLALAYLPFAFSGYGNLQVPFVDRLFLRRHAVLVLRSLALVVDGGRPIGLGLATLARHYPADWVRERLAGTSLAADQGHDWIAALRHYGLIRRVDAALLDASRRAGNLGWALRELAEGAGRRLDDRLGAIGQTLLLLILLGLAGLVGLCAAAYFLPLVTLIESLS